MIPDDAKQLLALASAFDNRKPSQAAAYAWADALADVPLDQDALDAVARYYGAPNPDGGRRWIEPGHVRALRQQARADRLGETIPAYDPPQPDETGSEFVRRRRAQLDRIAAGAEQPVSVQQLTGGPAPAVAARLSGIGRQIPAQPPEGFRESAGLPPRDPALARPCPTCRAPANARCTTLHGRRRVPHTARTA